MGANCSGDSPIALQLYSSTALQPRLHFKINLKFIVGAIALNDVADKRGKDEKVVFAGCIYHGVEWFASVKGVKSPTSAAHSIYVNVGRLKAVRPKYSSNEMRPELEWYLEMDCLNWKKYLF